MAVTHTGFNPVEAMNLFNSGKLEEFSELLWDYWEDATFSQRQKLFAELYKLGDLSGYHPVAGWYLRNYFGKVLEEDRLPSELYTRTRHDDDLIIDLIQGVALDADWPQEVFLGALDNPMLGEEHDAESSRIQERWKANPWPTIVSMKWFHQAEYSLVYPDWEGSASSDEIIVGKTMISGGELEYAEDGRIFLRRASVTLRIAGHKSNSLYYEFDAEVESESGALTPIAFYHSFERRQLL